MMRPSHDEKKRKQVRRAVSLRLLVVALAPATLANPAAAADFTRMASHVVLTGERSTAACRISNVGGAAVRVKDLKFQNYDGVTLVPTSNSCGSPADFSLGPRSTCVIQTRIGQFSSVMCSALVSDPGAIRAAVEEITDWSTSTAQRARLTPGSGSSSGSDFQLFASPPTFGISTQFEVYCDITNVGTTKVRLKDRRITTSTGAPIALFADGCGATPEATLEPGKTCSFVARADGPTTDRQCRLMATRKANLRGALAYDDVFLPPAEME